MLEPISFYLYFWMCPSVVFDENSKWGWFLTSASAAVTGPSSTWIFSAPGWSAGAGDLKYNKIYLEKYALESITAKYFILTEVVSVDHRINIERASLSYKTCIILHCQKIYWGKEGSQLPSLYLPYDVVM